MITIDSIKKYVTTTLLEGHTDPLEEDQDLLISGVLDSINVMKLAGYLEQECGITIPPEDIVLENFSTLEQMHRYVVERTGMKPGV